MAKGIKKGTKRASKEAKRLNKRIFGKKGPTMTHSFESVTSFYENGKEKNPIYSVSRSGEYKISLFKLILTVVCVIAAIAALAAVIKAVVDRYALRKALEDEDYEYLDLDDDELPF